LGVACVNRLSGGFRNSRKGRSGDGLSRGTNRNPEVTNLSTREVVNPTVDEKIIAGALLVSVGGVARA